MSFNDAVTMWIRIRNDQELQLWLKGGRGERPGLTVKGALIVFRGG